MTEAICCGRRLSTLVLLGALLACPWPARAAYDAFLRFQSPQNGASQVDGDAQDAQFPGTEGWTRLISFDYGIFNTAALPTSLGEGKAQFQDFNLTKSANSGSSALFLSCATGGHYEAVELVLRTSSASPEPVRPFFTVKLKTVFVTSLKWSGAGEEDRPVENLVLAYGSVEWTYTRFGLDGTPVSQSVNWDVTKNAGGAGLLPGDGPQIQCPGDMSVPTDPGLCSARVLLPVSASEENSNPTVTCVPAPGSVFARGVTPVQCTATDEAGLSTSCSFKVTVSDQERPVINLLGANPLTAECHSAFSDPGVIAQDNCDGNLTSATGTTGTVDANTVGTYTLHYNVSDAAGNAALEVTRTVNVVDTTPPVVTCPQPITQPTDPGKCSAVVTFSATAVDACSGNLTPKCVPPSGSSFQLGSTTVICSGTDAAGLSAQCSFPVTVKDMEPPVVTDVLVAPPILWPPDHFLREVTVNYSATDNCSVSTVLSVSSSEGATGAGANSTPAFEVVDSHHVQLRAERAPGGPGRVYTITITSTDGSGNSTAKTVVVTVPHDKGSKAGP